MPRSLVSIDDLARREIEAIFALADDIVDSMGEPGRPWRVRGRRSLAEGNVVATLFFEPSTRTRLSFESAVHRLGGSVITAADAASTSAIKGESIADMVRIVQGYADLIVMRHPWEGAAAVAAEHAEIPVVNAGDGGHEHPTQTLCDLYTLRREKGRLRGLSVIVCGDLRHGRTAHSLVLALARFGARIITAPAPGLGLPGHVEGRLRERCEVGPARGAACDALRAVSLPVDAMYVPIGEEGATPTADCIDAIYVTRAQKERLRDGESAGAYPVMGPQVLAHPAFRETIVMHPLPRVDELEYALDQDPRAVYFRQASYGVPVRMALLAALLGLKPALDESARPDARPLESPPSARCGNDRCVSNQETERRSVRPKFRRAGERLECFYCNGPAAR